MLVRCDGVSQTSSRWPILFRPGTACNVNASDALMTESPDSSTVTPGLLRNATPAPVAPPFAWIAAAICEPVSDIVTDVADKPGMVSSEDNAEALNGLSVMLMESS